MTDKPDKPPVDWERIELEYRAGQLTVVEIGRQCGVSHTAINKRAKKHGWTRGLADKVRNEASARLVSELVSPETERAAIEPAVDRIVQVVREHRILLTRARRLAEAMLGELEEATEKRDEIAEEIEIETASDRSPNRRATMLRAVSLPGRASTMVDLAGSIKTFCGLDRQAFNIDAPAPPSSDDSPQTAVVIPSDPIEAAKAYQRLIAGT